MKHAARTIATLVLIILFLIICLASILIGYSAAWLHTYKAFTDKTAVAEVTISEQKKDDKGQYVEVDFTPLETESALNTLITQRQPKATRKDTQHYKLYGDTVYIGGPIIKFKDELILLDFKTIYQVGKIFARYDIDNDKEKNRTPDIASTYDIDGGYSDWKGIHDDYVDDGLKGKITRMFIDTTQISSPGMFVDNKSHNYKLFITNNGFLWELQE